MHTYDLIIVGFIGALFLLALWWAFNTVRRIEIQKNFNADTLTSIAKLWRRAKFVPEDAKERESLYLYRDFLNKFEDSDCKYPIMVKNGKVRAMSRKEYDQACNLKPVRIFSPLVAAASIVLAVVAIVVNATVVKNIGLGIGLAAIMPVVQLVLSFFVGRFNKDCNHFRDGIFAALKENSINFLSITKPFVIVDAYPAKFGKAAESLYTVQGELSEEQVVETRDYIIRQKESEAKVVMQKVDNSAEINQIQNPELANLAQAAAAATPAPTAEAATADAPAATTVQNQPAPTSTETPAARPLSNDEQAVLINNLINDALAGDVKRAAEKAAKANATAAAEPVDELPPLPTNEVPLDTPAPADDDFSLDAIGQALDAEIAARAKKRK